MNTPGSSGDERTEEELNEMLENDAYNGRVLGTEQ
jgi:hypothetical protein